MSDIDDALIGSFKRVLINLAHFLPAVLALVVAIAVFALLGAGLSWLVRRLLNRVRFDERAGRVNAAGVTDWSPSHSPTLLVGRVVYWAVVVLGVVVGVSAYDSATSSSHLAPVFLPYLGRSIGAFLIALIGTLTANYLSRSVLISAANARLQYARMLSVGVKSLVFVFTGAMVLDHLQIGRAIVELGFGILFGGIVLTLALAIGLGSKEIVARSIERNTDKTTPIDQAIARTAGDTSRGVRHF
jgi:hypothetical protein